MTPPPTPTNCCTSRMGSAPSLYIQQFCRYFHYLEQAISGIMQYIKQWRMTQPLLDIACY